jgi:type III secretion system FlhB-like substrate exporter
MKNAPDANPAGDRPQHRRAVAVRYDAASGAAPKVVAGGLDHAADRIREVAAEHNVPLVEDADLVALLAACDVGEQIPEDLFEVVATLLAFLYELNGELKGASKSA